ncbi:hypothetical protein OG596_38325 (plasmid) [Streptomyces sp. NBC_01102]|uniref:hypothetical protein n=1 Tax=Streptomyces sp. NBC_01102 TaxID=2903749 RepID=UPI002F9168DF|nr:hypothetical protein OG596_38325 [Streptomyces sp. NBC_01102]
MKVGDAVAGLPRLRGRRGSGREQNVGERVSQTAQGDRPDRVMLSGPGGSYVMHGRVGYFEPPPHWQGLCITVWYGLPSAPT